MRPVHWLYTIPLRLRSLFRWAQADQELDDELREHLERKTEEYVAQGMTQEEAWRRARLDLGGVEKVKEECRDARQVNYIQNFMQDFRFAVRALRRSPILSAAAIFSLGVAIGANTALFGVMDAVLSRSLPVQEPEQLVLLSWSAKDWPKRVLCGSMGPVDQGDGGIRGYTFSYPAFERLQFAQSGLTDFFAFQTLEKAIVTGAGDSHVVQGQLISGNYFQALGLHAEAGRTIVPSDDQAGAAPVVVIGHRYGVNRFGGAIKAVGQSIDVNGVPFQIVGVAPRDFSGLTVGQSTDLFLPLSSQPLVAPAWAPPGRSLFLDQTFWWLYIMARQGPRASAELPQAKLTSAWRSSFSAEAGTGLPRLRVAPAPQGLKLLQPIISLPLSLLMCLVLVLMVVACANIVNLLLARWVARQKEMATRLAIGASRGHLIRQLLTESIVLACLAGVLGAAVAYWGIGFLVAMLPRLDWPITLDVHVDGRVLGFNFALAVGSGLLIGVLPALRSSCLDLTPALKLGTGEMPLRSGTASKMRSARLLIAAQMCVSMVLLAAMGFFVQSLRKLHDVDVGFQKNKLLLFTLEPGQFDHRQARLVGVYERVLEAVKWLPGVRAVSLSEIRPLSMSAVGQRLFAPGSVEGQSENTTFYNLVSEQFLPTMGIPILEGRGFERADSASKSKVAIINEEARRRFFPKIEPVGQQVYFGSGPEGDAMTIVGVAGNAKYNRLTGPTPPTIYLLYNQHQEEIGTMNAEVRAAGNPISLIPDVRRAVAAVDPNLPITNMETQVQQIDETLMLERLMAKLSAAFGAVALLLSATGLFGVVAYSVSRRQKELGIRMALGASSGSLMRSMLRQAMLPVLWGALVGLGLAVLIGSVARGLVYGVSPTDTTVLSIATAVLVLTGLLAAVIPAARLHRLDVVGALREE